MTKTRPLRIPSPLREALDRFAQFFKEPLFLASTLDRELEAVDSEYKLYLQNDTWRLDQLDRSLSNPKHPHSRFDVGSLELLKIKPEARGVNVRDIFMEFHEKHYSANRMKLIIIGRESLDLLQDWTVEFFSGIANKRLAPNRWTEEPPFRKEDIGVQWIVKPVMDSRELNLSFPFIDEEDLYESQPSRYCSHLIGHEGPGSIMSCLKNKGWADSLSAGADPICPGTPGVFRVKTSLTEDGLKVYPKIINIFFQDKTPASHFMRKVSSVMQKPLPRQWLLSHSRLRVFDAAHIKQALSKIRPENLRLSVVSRTFPGNWDKKEQWYGTEYSYDIIPRDAMEDWKRAISTPGDQRRPELYLPCRNIFIPKNFEVETKEVPKPALAPKILRNNAETRIWWKKDDTFWVPKANVIVSLENPLVNASAQNRVKARLFTQLVEDTLEERHYDAKLAGLEYTVSLDYRGMFLQISGYNDKLLLDIPLERYPIGSFPKIFVVVIRLMLQIWKRTNNLIRRRRMGFRSATVEASDDK